ncbi:MAG TPA: polyprenyl synthetase family protein [Candidatus Dormibacteraeota bacterium]|nr:polyprenyl synthetase family protein [Candidatus Dormibacteraeota bacterium]
MIEAELQKTIARDPDVVSAPMSDLFAAGGKRVRPALVLLTARLGDYDLERLTPAAMAVELVHAATLVHDDVIDRSPTRRGRPSVAAALGDEPAIVVGDYYFAKAYEQAARSQSAEVVAILANAVMRICAGEVHQQAIRYRYTTGIEEYMRRIEAKTATLLAACCDIGALLSGMSDEKRDAVREYGRLLGLAFQIADDVLDYLGTEDTTGKPSGHDLSEGFATLPLMLAMQDPMLVASLGHLLADGRALNADEAARVAARVRASDGPRVAIERARVLASEAAANLEGLGPHAASLVALADYVVSRKF